MATTDVPGAKPANNDKLDIGCWAEHADGSYILVEGFEDDRVVYSIFDPSKAPMLEYRDAMLIGDFEKAFSCNSTDIGKPYKDAKGRFVTKSQWTWHDKTKFPWDKIMSMAQDGPKFASAADQISAAQRVANDLGLRGAEVSRRGLGSTSTKRSIRERLGAALSALAN